MCEKLEPILYTKHLCKSFGEMEVCKDINIQLYKGRTLGMVGESGAGKSTLIRMLMQLEEPTSGNLYFHGADMTTFSKKEIWENRQKIQMVFQDPLGSFHPKKKVCTILTEPLYNYGRLKKENETQKAIELLELVGLSEAFLYRYPREMSGGQRQRVSIARALSLEPELLICDEATSALDVSVQHKIIELLVRLQQEKGISLLFICHDIALIRSFAHDIAVLYKGEIVDYCKGEELLESVHPYTKELITAHF